MSGNVWEWCEDSWNESYSKAPPDGSARLDPGSSKRVDRGGSFESVAAYCRSSNRDGRRPDLHDSSLGFRPACSFLADGEKRRAPPRKRRFESEDATGMSAGMAAKRALATLGLPAGMVTTKADMVKVKGRLVPFIGPGVERAVWRVRIDNVKIEGPDGNRTMTNPYIRRLTVFLSPDKGQVMKVVSNRAEHCRAKPFPSVESEERQMKQIQQVFTGVPEGKPGITLMQAIPKAVGWGTATRIIAYYVLEEYGTPKTKPRPVWVIHARGMPPFPTHGPSSDKVPVDSRNHMRTVMDADTGEFRGADTIPQPDSR